MQDDHDTAAPAEQTEPGAAGEVIKRSRFGIGSKAIILMGLTVAAVSVLTAVPVPAAMSSSVSYP